MKSFHAFLKKEMLQQTRGGKIMILGILFVFFGILNPATAKLTPWLLKLVADSVEGRGFIVESQTITAMDSWAQFFKNAPTILIAFILVECSIMTGEYGRGTLVLPLTKGLQRYKVVLSKFILTAFLWTAGYWIYYGITYAYSAYFWDNSIAQNLFFAAVCCWLYGIFAVSLLILFSTIGTSVTGALLGTAAVAFGSKILGILPKVKKFLPDYLCDGTSLLVGTTNPNEYIPAAIVTAVVIAGCILAGISVFNKKRL